MRNRITVNIDRKLLPYNELNVMMYQCTEYKRCNYTTWIVISEPYDFTILAASSLIGWIDANMKMVDVEIRS